MLPTDNIIEQMMKHGTQFETAMIHCDEYSVLMPFTATQIRQMGYSYARVFADGQVWAVAPFSISNGRLFIDLNDCGYDDFYCFSSYDAALKALIDFDPETMDEPIGWHRHGKSHRRRENGDPSKETICK